MTDDPRFDSLLRTALADVTPPTRLPERIAVRVGRAEARRRAIRAGTAVSVVIVLMAAAIVAVDRRDDRPVVADASARPFRWERLPDPPLSDRVGAATVWTGSEVLMWGGRTGLSSSRAGLQDDGAAYDPATRQWRMLAPAPIGPRSGHAAVWTGREMLVWGGVRPEGEELAGYADGALYDPVADTWRTIREAPIGGRVGAGVAWTGVELIVVGGTPTSGPWSHSPVPRPRPALGAAFDPVRNEWRVLPDLGFESTADGWATWTGEEVLYWRPMVTGVDPAVFAYDPRSNTWTERANPGAHFRFRWSSAMLIWADDRLVAASRSFGGRGDTWEDAEAIAYDPVRDRWERVALTENTDNALAFALLSGAAWTGREIVALEYFGSTASALEPRTGRWHVLPAPPERLRDASLTVTDDGDVYAIGHEATARLTRDP